MPNVRLPRHLRPRLVAAAAAALAVAAGTATVAAAAADTPTSAMTATTMAGPPWSSGGAGSAGRSGELTAAVPGRADLAHTEHFHVVSTTPSGPGSIVVTGVVNAGGTEHPGRAIDGATFAGGHLRIDHSSGHPTVRFDPTTCVGSIAQDGPFRVIDATGTMSSLEGTGHYAFRALYTTARVAGHCSQTMTGYVETIDGVATVKG